MIGRVPELPDTSVPSLQAWFKAIHAWTGGGWHADDPATDLAVFTNEEGVYVERCMEEIRAAAAAWPDPDYLYTLCGDGPARADSVWPGFVLDAHLDSARIGNPSFEGREYPNVVMEDGGVFFMIEFREKTGFATAHDEFRIMEVDGARFGVNGRYVDLSEAAPVEETAVTFHDLSDVDRIVNSRLGKSVGCVSPHAR
jgi:hypothetical protein